MTMTKRNTHHFLPKKVAKELHTSPVTSEGHVRLTSQFWLI